MQSEQLQKWQTQLRKGALELCVLSLIEQTPTYAFALIQSLESSESFTVTEGVLYPLLKRLQKDQLLSTFWTESESGPPRKYYQITQEGETQLAVMKQEWLRFSDFVTGTLGQGPASHNPKKASSIQPRIEIEAPS